MCQAAWLLTVAGGNFIVIIIAESSAFENRVRVIIISTEKVPALLSQYIYMR